MIRQNRIRNIVNHCRRGRWTQVEISKAYGVSQSYISQVLSGQWRRKPRKVTNQPEIDKK